jgi:single-strand DNA-binding protein
MNKVILIGNVVKDIQIKQVAGYQVIQNTIAVKRSYPDKDGNYPTDFIEFQSWGKQAEYLSKYCAKGSKLAITGRLQSREYEGRDGLKRVVWEVVTDEIQALTSIQQPKQDINYNTDPFRNNEKTVNNEIKKEQPLDTDNRINSVSEDDLPF